MEATQELAETQSAQVDEVPTKKADKLFEKGDRIAVFNQAATVLSATEDSAVIRLNTPIFLAGNPVLVVHKMLNRMTIVLRRATDKDLEVL